MKTSLRISLLCILLAACHRSDSLFDKIPAASSGIDFINKVEEDSIFNVLEYMNIYTGAGVAAGDIDNDGLTDLFFAGNQVSGRLYKNKGNLKFEDITEKAGIQADRWQTGVSMADINQDGWLDIYVCVSGSEKFGNQANLLYINNRNGTFTESAARYGIAEQRPCMNASFFDYDRDGDLDLFLITNPADQMQYGINSITERKINRESPGTDILYRNNGNGSFSDVSKEAGILVEGYSLGAAISDLNKDGWPDIYVSNDFLTNDILYINNRDGTFTDELGKRMKHTSFASMGNDVADFNNDGHPDVYVLDMLPEDNYRKKMIIPPASYDKFKLSLMRGYEPQYTRNTLQLNNGDGSFSDIAFLAGVSNTDWSWSALFADYDLDGDKDLMVTNGFYRDLGNQDYIHYQAKLKNPMGKQTVKREEKLKAIRALAAYPLRNYFFENEGDLQFSNQSENWGFTDKGFSNGACYADLDNDGDLELIINEFNQVASIYKNQSREQQKGHYLSVSLNGTVPNRQAIGAKLTLFTKGRLQYLELNPYRGFESSMQPLLHFGLGRDTLADSLKIEWPDGGIQWLRQIKADQQLTINYHPGSTENHLPNSFPAGSLADSLGLQYLHAENEFNDFTLQPLLPHMHSMGGPGIAVGDINKDQLEDFYIGGATGTQGTLFVQQVNGRFIASHPAGTTGADEMGLLFFDADNDEDLDLYIVHGGSEQKNGSAALQDQLLRNDGKGNFTPASLPDTRSSGSCVVAADYDRDGDLDLFVGGRLESSRYPLPGRSYLLRNDTRSKDQPLFTDVTPDYLQHPGMVTSAMWTDFDNDNWPDLVVTGEFMPIRFFRNMNASFTDITRQTGISDFTGWWNNIVGGDFDEDGDIDYVAGNLGLNSRLTASIHQPFQVYAKDFDRNGLLDPIPAYYVQGEQYIYSTRDEMIRQINSMRGRFPTYESYASATFSESFTPQELADATILSATCFESSYFENLGNGKFKRIALPVMAQIAPVYGIQALDINQDGHTDLVLTGNDYATEASTGRYDAMQGLVLLNNGHASFNMSKEYSALAGANRDSKGTAVLHLNQGELLLVANNDDSLQTFRLPATGKMVSIRANDVYGVITGTNGKQYRKEFYWGNNYLSQGTRDFNFGKATKEITIFDSKGRSRHESNQ
jgi:hypothetical protein